MISEKDKQDIQLHGIKESDVEFQIEDFKKGFPYAELIEAATLNKGILTFDKEELDDLVEVWDNESTQWKIIKFVPASGAASRMFKKLFDFSENYDGSKDEYNKFISDRGFDSVYNFIINIKKFAFYPELEKRMNSVGLSVDICLSEEDYKTIVDFVLFDKGLGYAALPKALIEFHKYSNRSRTALEEHLVEGAVYCKSAGDIVNIHFTVSPEHLEKFKKTITEILPLYEKYFEVKYNIEYSVQKLTTDTIAVDMENKPFRDKNGNLVFRPAGHGALLENLNDLDADIVFIKNIDNVVPDSLKDETFRFKKILGGLLLVLQKKISAYIRILESGNYDELVIDEIESFAKQSLFMTFNKDFDNKYYGDKAIILLDKLNRPIRVCGMVKNEGEPGGGPFFVKDSNGNVALQIVESSQIDHSNAIQNSIFKNATHFNPVDLVCGVINADREKFNLMDFRDPNTGFISIKSKDGKELKAMELPGLWNGAMANWITVFMQVPALTFNPVKSVNDLLRKEHTS